MPGRRFVPFCLLFLSFPIFNKPSDCHALEPALVSKLIKLRAREARTIWKIEQAKKKLQDKYRVKYLAGDYTWDGYVDSRDLNLLIYCMDGSRGIQNLGRCVLADSNGDGGVDGSDLTRFASQMGSPPVLPVDEKHRIKLAKLLKRQGLALSRLKTKAEKIFLKYATPFYTADYDWDGYVNYADRLYHEFCLGGTGGPEVLGLCSVTDINGDGMVNSSDTSMHAEQTAAANPTPTPVPTP